MICANCEKEIDGLVEQCPYCGCHYPPQRASHPAEQPPRQEAPRHIQEEARPAQPETPGQAPHAQPASSAPAGKQADEKAVPAPPPATTQATGKAPAKYCKECGHPLSEETRFCKWCGTPCNH